MARKLKTPVHEDWRCIRLLKRDEFEHLAWRACHLAEAAMLIADVLDNLMMLGPSVDTLVYEASSRLALALAKTLEKIADVLQRIEIKSDFVCKFGNRTRMQSVATMLEDIADAMMILTPDSKPSDDEPAFDLLVAAMQLVHGMMATDGRQLFEPSLSIRSMNVDVGLCGLIKEGPPEKLWKPLSWDDIAAGFMAVFG